jgi:hypothetical protein
VEVWSGAVTSSTACTITPGTWQGGTAPLDQDIIVLEVSNLAASQTFTVSLASYDLATYRTNAPNSALYAAGDMVIGLCRGRIGGTGGYTSHPLANNPHDVPNSAGFGGMSFSYTIESSAGNMDTLSRGVWTWGPNANAAWLFINFSAASFHSHLASLADPFTVLDSVVKKPGIKPIETYSVSDSVTETYIKTLAKSDPFTLVDSVSKAPSRIVADTYSVTDAFTPAHSEISSYAETFSLTDSYTKLHGQFTSLSDAFTLLDSILEQHSELATYGEVLSVIETFSQVHQGVQNFSDVMTIVDSVLPQHNEAVIFADTFTVTDTAVFVH